MILTTFRRNRRTARALEADVDATLRHLGQLVATDRISIASEELLEQLASPSPAREGRSVEFEIVDARTDEVLIRGAAPELDLGQARRLAAAASVRLGRQLRLTYTAMSVFTPQATRRN